ncbi:hypothetical protein EYZ11_011454 [Aspergillus tanneri]|uniref:Uncharacterized protein n=1 Tax=Aspergillus tanneri TaxID=1220188 RepID=A0A4S3J4X0_9EURO|nr:hypothetical protein EYZ11_011454 [Aspergillus tanneri]
MPRCEIKHEFDYKREQLWVSRSIVKNDSILPTIQPNNE